MHTRLCSSVLLATALSCEVPREGPEGPKGPAGAQGPQGPAGMPAMAGSRLQPRSIVGADGSRVPFSIWDSQRKEVCRFVLAEDQKLRCLPAFEDVLIFDNLYGDPACADPVFYTSLPIPCPLAYGRVKIAGTCDEAGPFEAVFALTKIGAPGTRYISSGGACINGGPANPALAWWKGTRIAPTEFVAGTAE